MLPLVAQARMAYADYFKINDGNRYELLDGELIMVPAPNTDHQDISRNILFLMWDYVKKNRSGKVFNAPIDVVFDDHHVFQPDLIFIRTENLNIIKKNAIHGVPDITVEIISPSSVFYDTVEKKEIYRKFGVKEYWLVFPEEHAIEIFTLEGEEYSEYLKIHKKGFIKSNVISGLNIDINEIFDN